MGISVALDILAADIEPRAWEQVYDETLSLLQRHPARIFGLNRRKIESCDLLLYTFDLERNPPDEGRHWHVSGAARTMESAEANRMFRDVAYYQRDRHGAQDGDVLLFKRRALEGKSDAQLRRVFGGKTQGSAVHVPLLACAMLVEDRFPGLALAGGDIDREQAEAARVLASEAAGHEVGLPVRLDARALLERLGAALSGEELAEAFATLLIADESVGEGALAPLLEALPRAAVERWFAGRIGGQHTVDLFVQWLNATSELKRLCELGCVEPWGPRMKAETFIDALAHTWIG
jgi:hypothetical protein